MLHFELHDGVWNHAWAPRITSRKRCNSLCGIIRRFEAEVASKWGSGASGPGIDRIRVNVGGEVFETTKDVLCKDRFSMLAALCSDVYPKGAGHSSSGTHGKGSASSGAGRASDEAQSESIPFVDRDWWLFRHILAFLQGGADALPDDVELLR